MSACLAFGIFTAFLKKHLTHKAITPLHSASTTCFLKSAPTKWILHTAFRSQLLQARKQKSTQKRSCVCSAFRFNPKHLWQLQHKLQNPNAHSSNRSIRHVSYG